MQSNAGIFALVLYLTLQCSLSRSLSAGRPSLFFSSYRISSCVPTLGLYILNDVSGILSHSISLYLSPCFLLSLISSQLTTDRISKVHCCFVVIYFFLSISLLSSSSVCLVVALFVCCYCCLENSYKNSSGKKESLWNIHPHDEENESGRNLWKLKNFCTLPPTSSNGIE